MNCCSGIRYASVKFRAFLTTVACGDVLLPGTVLLRTRDILSGTVPLEGLVLLTTKCILSNGMILEDVTVLCIIAFPTDVTIRRNDIGSSIYRDSPMNSTNVIRYRDHYNSYGDLICVINKVCGILNTRNFIRCSGTSRSPGNFNHRNVTRWFDDRSCRGAFNNWDVI